MKEVILYMSKSEDYSYMSEPLMEELGIEPLDMVELVSAKGQVCVKIYPWEKSYKRNKFLALSFRAFKALRIPLGLEKVSLDIRKIGQD